MNMFPLVIMIAIFLAIVSMLFGGGGDCDGFGYGVRRYWWVIALMGLPIILIVGGGDMFFIIFILIAVLVGGGLFFWWMENDFELPKGDPIKNGLKWLRENFRW